MSLKTIYYKGKYYPEFQAKGNASQYIIPFAKQVCIGVGYDIGYGKDEWKFPGAIGIELNDSNNGNNLPDGTIDYIFSSHCLEHVDNWITTLEHWLSKLRFGGVLFLYLPHYSQEYWRPWNNRKHKHVLDPQVLRDFLQDHDMTDIFVSGIDLNNSFAIMCKKNYPLPILNTPFKVDSSNLFTISCEKKI